MAYCGKYNADYSAYLKNAVNLPCLNEFLGVFSYVRLHIVKASQQYSEHRNL